MLWLRLCFFQMRNCWLLFFHGFLGRKKQKKVFHSTPIAVGKTISTSTTKQTQTQNKKTTNLTKGAWYVDTVGTKVESPHDTSTANVNSTYYQKIAYTSRTLDAGMKQVTFQMRVAVCNATHHAMLTCNVANTWRSRAISSLVVEPVNTEHAISGREKNKKTKVQRYRSEIDNHYK